MIWIFQANIILTNLMDNQNLENLEDFEAISKQQVQEMAQTHKERVAQLVVTDTDLIEELFKAPEESGLVRSGPRKTPYADKRHKEIIYLTGTNIILMKKLIRMVNDPKAKSAILNKMIEFFVEHCDPGEMIYEVMKDKDKDDFEKDLESD